MRLTGRLMLLLLLAVSGAAAQSKDDEESVDTGHHVEGSGNAPNDDEDFVEGSGLPPSQVYTKLTTIVHARPAVQVKTTTQTPEPPKKKDPLPPIINMDLMEKEQQQKEKDQEKFASIAPAIPGITTGQPESAPLISNLVLGGILAAIVILIIAVIVIIVVCRSKHKSDYTPGRQE
ncbi:hypothetical protein PMAYCL1PPCAC_31877 [Pristionchus mayeri]|uniref:Uncharacterized protein n=1 Tax=Pristionchus mayeri TaxID=1317129 RepID=A0AAN5DFP5_9BILA|nr:hypothetical protein PMAYCL1PPCAC_31877 [Pristionchus mayeri]